MEWNLVMTAMRMVGGGGRCGYRRCEVYVGEREEEFIAMGGKLICQRCMAELLEEFPDQIERA